MTASLTPHSSIHRRHRDLDIVLFFFLFLFVSFEFVRFMKTEEQAFEPLAETGQEIKNSFSDGTDIIEKFDIAVNWDHVLSDPNCKLSDADDSPLPLIFMALGRTGSSITWATVAKIMGDPEPEKAIEIVGRINTETTDFYNTIPDQLASSWPSSYICDLQSNFTERGLKAGLVGFQWKPYMSEFDNSKSLSGLRDLAASNVAHHPKIRVIFKLVIRLIGDCRIGDITNTTKLHHIARLETWSV